MAQVTPVDGKFFKNLKILRENTKLKTKKYSENWIKLKKKFGKWKNFWKLERYFREIKIM